MLVDAPTYNYDDPPGSFGTFEIDEGGRFSCCDGQGWHLSDCEFSPEHCYEDEDEDEDGLAAEGVVLGPDDCGRCGAELAGHCATCGGCPFVGMHPSSCSTGLVVADGQG